MNTVPFKNQSSENWRETGTVKLVFFKWQIWDFLHWLQFFWHHEPHSSATRKQTHCSWFTWIKNLHSLDWIHMPTRTASMGPEILRLSRFHLRKWTWHKHGCDLAKSLGSRDLNMNSQQGQGRSCHAMFQSAVHLEANIAMNATWQLLRHWLQFKMSLSKPNDDGFFHLLLKNYARLLKERPVITKACTRFVDHCWSIVD